MMLLLRKQIILLLVTSSSFVHGMSVSNYKQSEQDNVTKIQDSSIDCDCGVNGRCIINANGINTCDCDSGYKARTRYETVRCVVCDCGTNGHCSFDEDGIKTCECDSGFAIKTRKVDSLDECVECDCGVNGRCRYYATGEKHCDCDSGYTVKTVDKQDRCVAKCSSNEDCKHGGECIKESCRCKPGTVGEDCSEVTGCKALKCEEKDAVCMYDSAQAPDTFCVCNDPTYTFTGNRCAEKCDNDCKNGGKCNAQTKLCNCLPQTSGDKCEIIESCDVLKCEEKNATCIYDAQEGQKTCVCNDNSYYYENGKCKPEWCRKGCNDEVSVCEYNNGIGVCKCKAEGTYYDYSAGACKSIEKCINTTCNEGEICRDGFCECAENYEKWGGKSGGCYPRDLCMTSKECFPGAKCEATSTFGYVRCGCLWSHYFYNSRTRKCEDGRCLFPSLGYCTGSCPPGMVRHDGFCEHISERNYCDNDCGSLGWCYKISESEIKCVCDPTFAELDQRTGKCVLNSTVVCPMGKRHGEDKCNCTGKYKDEGNGITCELKSCSDEDVQKECKNKRAVKCKDNWKGNGYKCICPNGYIDHPKKGCVDPCSLDNMKDACASVGQVCYLSDKVNLGDCRCPPTFTYNPSSKSCDFRGTNAFMVHRLPVLKKKYEIDEHINEVLLSIDVITSMKHTFNNLDFANVFSFNIEEDVLLCDVWIQFKDDLTARFTADLEIQRWSLQTMKINNHLLLPPSLLLNSSLLNEVTKEELAICSSSVQQLVCGKGSICYDNKCDCAPGFRIIDSTIKVSRSARILRCEDIDECSENIHNCPPSTFCMNTPGDFYCQCKPGYTRADRYFLGNSKEPCIGLCDSNPCRNGTCQIIGDNSIYCNCDESFSGPFCEERIAIETKTMLGPLFIGIFTFLCILILMMSSTLCYICVKKKRN